MWDKMLAYVLENHRGKAIGILLGLIAAILVVSFGFWKTFFIVLCIALGYVIGKAADENTSFEDWFKKNRGR